MAKDTKQKTSVKDDQDLPDTVDIYVGGRVRDRRLDRDLSQSALGEILGITFQQVQKYERGANRISASRLFHLGQILDVPIEFFFDGYEDKKIKKARRETKKKPQDFSWLEGGAGDLMNRRETIELVETYYQVRDPKVRKYFRDVMTALINQR